MPSMDSKMHDRPPKIPPNMKSFNLQHTDRRNNKTSTNEMAHTSSNRSSRDAVLTPFLPAHDGPFNSLSLQDSLSLRQFDESVQILDDEERLLIKTEEEFATRLGIDPNDNVKVVSIFGNTGGGKSYTLNHTFFKGREVFQTSPSQISCTIGVWAKYEPDHKIICLDTEGLLGVSKKEHQRTRLLLKVLAISDIVIYRTKDERLTSDFFTFVGGASKVYKEYFSGAVKNVLQKNGIEQPSTSLVGPSLIIFHETSNTNTYNDNANVDQSAEDIIRERFDQSGQSYDGFSSMKYFGVRTNNNRGMFKDLHAKVSIEVESKAVRSPRPPKYIFLTLKGLNEKYQCEISELSTHPYLAYFACQDRCLSCSASCNRSMGHKDEGQPHNSDQPCLRQHQYQNFVYICKKCHLNGIRQVVMPSHKDGEEQFWNSMMSVWSGYVIECKRCGKIYESRKYWYGNKDPTDEAVQIDVVHVWPGERNSFGSQNSAQKVLDSVTSLTNAMASVGSQPTKLITDWVTDQIAPTYWKPNNEIVECYKCRLMFASNASKHHCRACGEGFCEACSSRTQPVPSKGWLEDVRVCDFCYREDPPSLCPTVDDAEVRTRKIGETVINSFSAVKSVVLDIPKEMIKDTVRPTYWTPDNECMKCAVCDRMFGALLRLHHCRDCGKGVCDSCSNARKPVPIRGWDTPVRICDNCCKG